MHSSIEWNTSTNPVERGAYTVLLDVGTELHIKTAYWSPSSGLWFCECGYVYPEAWAQSIKHT